MSDEQCFQSLSKLYNVITTTVGCVSNTIKTLALNAFEARWAITAVIVLCFFIYEARHYMDGVNQATLNDRLDQRKAVTDAIHEVAGVIKKGL